MAIVLAVGCEPTPLVLCFRGAFFPLCVVLAVGCEPTPLVLAIVLAVGCEPTPFYCFFKKMENDFRTLFY